MMIRIDREFVHEAKKPGEVSFGQVGQVTLTIANGPEGTPVFKFGASVLSERLVDALLNGALTYRFGNLAASKTGKEEAQRAFKEKIASWQDDTVTFRGDGSSGMGEEDALTAREFMKLSGFKFERGDVRDTDERNDFLFKMWRDASDSGDAKKVQLAAYARTKAVREIERKREQEEEDRLFRLSLGDVKL
jgi:hypothetical protein